MLIEEAYLPSTEGEVFHAFQLKLTGHWCEQRNVISVLANVFLSVERMDITAIYQQYMGGK